MFTLKEIKNYIKSQDSFGDVAYNLSENNIRKANDGKLQMDRKTFEPSIQLNWYSSKQPAVIFNDGTEFVHAIPVSYEDADILIESGMNHGS